MTLINLHGILAYEFKPTMLMAINKPKEVIEAISSKFSLFRNRLVDLAEQGIHYTILIDGEKIHHFDQLNISRKPKQIDLVPSICGRGAGAAIAAIGAIAAGAGAAGTAAMGTVLIGTLTVGQLVTSVGLMMVSIGLQMALAPKPDMQRPESTVSGAKQSFMISSKANTAEQGNPVPVGYGRLRVGSAIIQSSVKSYPQRYDVVDALAGDDSRKIAVVTKSKE